MASNSNSISSWSWTSSTARQNFFNVLLGSLPANPEYLSHTVWNDLVDKVHELVVATNAVSAGWDETYATYADTYCYPGDSLSAVKFNSIWQNVNKVCTKISINPLTSEGVWQAIVGYQVLGIYLIKVTDKINEIIKNGW